VEYAAILIRVVNDDFHDSPHRGKNMNGRSPRAVFSDGDNRAVKRKPTESELRKCRMGMVTLSLDKKEASFRFKMKGFDMEMKYCAPELLHLSAAQRHAKFAVYFDYGRPELPVSVWQNGGFICDAYPKESVDFIEEDGKQTAAHMEAKNKYLAAVKRMKKEIAKAGADALPYFNPVPSTSALDVAQGEPVIAPSTKPKATPVLVSPIQPDPNRPGEYIDTDTGERYVGYATQLEQERQAQIDAEKEGQDTAKYLEELRRTQEELRGSAYSSGMN
jgi:hypothetical protein